MKTRHVVLLMIKFFMIGLAIGYFAQNQPNANTFFLWLNTLANQTEVNCLNTIDDDDDGKIDCADQDCRTQLYCATTEKYCHDKIDNDGDGNKDCADKACVKDTDCKQECGNFRVEYPETCDDGVPKSGDGCTDKCQREYPTCNIGWEYGIGSDSNMVTITTASTKHQTRINIKSVSRNINQGNSIDNPTLPISYTYALSGTYQAIIKIANKDFETATTLCTLNIDVKGTFGCTDPYASNYNKSATLNDGTCKFNNPKSIKCSQIALQVNNNNPKVNETIQFRRSLPSRHIASTSFYPGYGSGTIQRATSPVVMTYPQAGTYLAQVILTTTQGLTQSCNYSIQVGKKGCTNPSADNFDPQADLENNSCIITPGKGFVKILTREPYDVSQNAIKGHVQFDGNEQNITITVILSQRGVALQQYTSRLNGDGSFIVQLDSTNTSGSNTIQPGLYDISIKAQHYKSAQSYDSKIFKNITIGDKHGSAEICGNQLLDQGEECDGSFYCTDCLMKGLSSKQKAAIEFMVDQKIKERQKQYPDRSMVKKRFQSIHEYLVKRQLTGSQIQLYFLNNITYKILSS